MSEGVHITRIEWTQLMKEIKFLRDYIVNTSKPPAMRKWISETEAMELIGCKKRKLQQLRLDKELEYKYASLDKNNNGKGVLISRASVEAYIEATTKEGIYQAPLKKPK